MKLKIYMVWMSILALLSCNPSEQEPVTPQEELFPLNLSLFLKEEILPFPGTRGIPPLDVAGPKAETRGDELKSLKDLCLKIEYIVFKDGDNTPFRTRTYTHEELDFGTIPDKLPRGEYVFVLVAHNSSSMDITGNNLLFSQLADTFYYTFKLEIKPGDNFASNITLYRVVSKIEFVSTDTVPENAKELNIQLDKYSFLLEMFSGYGVIPEDPALFTYPLSDHIGQTGITHSFFTFVPEEGVSMTANLKAMDMENDVLRERIVEDIHPVTNHIIRYTGTLYNPSHSEDEFSISIEENGKWGGVIEDEIGD